MTTTRAHLQNLRDATLAARAVTAHAQERWYTDRTGSAAMLATSAVAQRFTGALFATGYNLGSRPVPS